jgi:uncharacterized protein YgiM (DUF1202 family)
MYMRLKFPALLSALLLAAATATFAASMSVQVQSTQVRGTPSFLGPVVTTIQYADRVEVVAKQGAWVQVRANGQTGWVSESALTPKKIVLKADAEDVRRTASGEEMALAGKGFNSQVEADFKSKNRDVDFTWIDRMETYKVSDNEIVQFLREGGLK